MKQLLGAVVLVLLLPVLALPALAAAYQGTTGSGVGGASCLPGSTDDVAVTCPAVPSPPANYASGGSRCVRDPSGTGGCVTPALAHLYTQVEAAFGHLPAACWSPRPGDPYSDHPKGRACDYTFGRIGTYPGPVDVARGWTLARWLRANATALHVNYVIWQGRIWSRRHDAQGWRPYTGGGRYPSTGPTYGHFDHVHVSTADGD